MKFVLTGINPAHRPDLERKLIVTDDHMALTIDRTDAKGCCQYNELLRVKRRQDSYHITTERVYDLYPNGYETHYQIGGATHVLKVRTLEYSPTTLSTSILDRENDLEITGPTFTLDKQCIPAWRALVTLMVAETDLDVLVRIAQTVTRSRYISYGMTPNVLIAKLTTAPA